MPYTTNKNVPRIRRTAADLVRRGWSARKVGRYLGYHHTAVMKWVRKARSIGFRPIPTQSSRPHTHPRRKSELVEREIVRLRLATGRCTEAIHLMMKDRMSISRNTVHRILDRHGLLKKRSHLKRWHKPVERPEVAQSGDLVEVDTIHRMIDEKKQLYVFSLVDVHSRSAYAKAYRRMNGRTSLDFVREAEQHSSFKFSTIQSDHGPEFSRWFVERIRRDHCFTRLGKPNDNAHIERFNRTLQEECLDKVPTGVRKINCALKKYLKYYNTERIHLSLNTTPAQVVPRS
ncbi:DDE-type integrase/transposase/recombinase [Patescibacteria group bacterium]|nr:DDE-type integrase/transposase/recombinase [Patescibacteria group bacterium]